MTKSKDVLPPTTITRADTDGVVIGNTAYYPGVLPLSGLHFDQIPDVPLFYVFALTNKNGAKKGQRYSVRAVTMTGALALNGLPGLHVMSDFVEAVKGPFTPENDN